MNIAHYYHTSGILQLDILLVLIAITLVVYFFIKRFLNDARPKFFLATLLFGIFFYSGFGIAYEDIEDRFVFHYAIFIISFSIPFILCRNVKPSPNITPFDRGLFRNIKTIRFLAYLYLILELVPLIFPEFRLFDIISFKTESIHELRAISKGNVIVSIADTLAVLIAPFFYASFTVEQELNPKTKKPLIFFILLIILQYGRYNYIGRYMMMTDIANILLILYCVKGFRYNIKLKHLLIGAAVVLMMSPILFLYTYFRAGQTYIGNYAFSSMLEMLMRSEFYFPAFYSDTLKHLDFMDESIEKFIKYIVCIPIPSALWPDKPTYNAIMSFTYMFTGYSRGESGFYILLPSIMGESFISGGEKWFWVFALCSGTVISLVFRYLCSNKTLTFYTFFIIVYGFTYARGGSTGLLPLLINGSLAIFLYDFFAKKLTKRKNK